LLAPDCRTDVHIGPISGVFLCGNARCAIYSVFRADDNAMTSRAVLTGGGAAGTVGGAAVGGVMGHEASK
jgi:hypothetical protein